MLTLLLLDATARAQSGETVVRLPSTSYTAGQELVFSILVTNPGTGPVQASFPDILACRLLSSGFPLRRVKAQAVESLPGGNQTIAPGGFATRDYRLGIPSDLEGTVALELDDRKAPSVLFVASPVAESEPLLTDQPDRYDSLDSLFTLYQPYLANIAAYEPIYFLVGSDPEDSKFQVSFKYRFFNDDNPVSQTHPWMMGFHFGYTQTSFWDLASDSAPFEDTSYKPELFYTSSNISFRPAWLEGLFLQAGGRHESNGRGGEFSRSTNTLYAKPIFIFYDEARDTGLQIAPRIWTYVRNDDDTNPDLADYRGYFDVEVKFGKADSFVAGATFGWAAEGGSVQFDLTYPLHQLFFNNLDLYLHLQYVNALAESLIDYRQRNEAFRIGFAVVR